MDMLIATELKRLELNIDDPPEVGKDGLLRQRRKPIDLKLTLRLLELVESPLIVG